jgi:hypothetical protein
VHHATKALEECDGKRCPGRDCDEVLVRAYDVGLQHERRALGELERLNEMDEVSLRSIIERHARTSVECSGHTSLVTRARELLKKHIGEVCNPRGGWLEATLCEHVSNDDSDVTLDVCIDDCRQRMTVPRRIVRFAHVAEAARMAAASQTRTRRRITTEKERSSHAHLPLAHDLTALPLWASRRSADGAVESHVSALIIKVLPTYEDSCEEFARTVRWWALRTSLSDDASMSDELSWLDEEAIIESALHLSAGTLAEYSVKVTMRNEQRQLRIDKDPLKKGAAVSAKATRDAARSEAFSHVSGATALVDMMHSYRFSSMLLHEQLSVLEVWWACWGVPWVTAD